MSTVQKKIMKLVYYVCIAATATAGALAIGAAMYAWLSTGSAPVQVSPTAKRENSLDRLERRVNRLAMRVQRLKEYDLYSDTPSETDTEDEKDWE